MFEKMKGTTPDLTVNNIEKLKQLFPEIITDGKIDFDKLQLVLGEEIDDAPDRYNFTWHGKKETMQFAQQPSKGTLRPVKEKSKDWDTTENLYIEGDNLEVLKLLQKSYNNKVKMIYIDPPYNTGNDFVYKDNFKNSVDSYLELTNQKDNEGNKFTSNTESNGRYHTDWLNMMYSRLKLARNLLTEDGVIFISIDDNEQTNLKKICDETFGEKNFVSNFVWSGGRKNDSKLISNSHEYVLIYVKDINVLSEKKIIWREKKQGLAPIYAKAKELYELYGEEEGSKQLKKWFSGLNKDNPSKAHQHYSNVDRRGPYFKADISWPGGGGPVYDVIHPKTKKVVKIPSRGWLFKKEKLEELILEERISFGENESQVPTHKRYLKQTEKQVPLSFVYNDNRGSMKRLRSLFNGEKLFEFPKDELIIKKFIEFIPMEKDSIILDFFSGSATTAHATMQLNAEDGGSRKFIMVQLPEILDEKSEAFKEGYRTICDIGEERIRRAGEKLKKELIERNNKEGMLSEGQLNSHNLDIGFKVFNLDTSNVNEWQADFNDIETKIDLFESNIVNNRSEEDILYEIILKNGLNLTYPINEVSTDGFKIYDVAFGNLFVCLNDKINRNVAHKIASLKEDYDIETSQVVFKDNGFENDTEKLNCYEILKDAGYQDSDLLSI